MTKMKKIFFASLLFVFTVSCSFVAGGVTPPIEISPTPAPDAAESNAPIRDFDSIVFNAPGILEITQGETEALEISGDLDFVPAIRAEVKDRRLEISAGAEVPSNASLKYQLVVKDLSEIVLNSFSAIKIPAMKTQRLAIKINGAGRVQAGGLSADLLTVEIFGDGNFSAGELRSTSAKFISRGGGNLSIASGSADELSLELESGMFVGDNFESRAAVVTVNGTGNVLVWATQTLNVKVNGAGSVTYYGEPTLSMSMSGGGKVVGGGRK